MAQYFTIHPVNPQPRLIRQAVEIMRDGGVIVYPTDSCYALGCRHRRQGGDGAHALRSARSMRAIISRWCAAILPRSRPTRKVDNRQFRLLKAATPGSYTFILQATREVPQRLQHPSRRTVGVRMPDHRVVHALLAELGEPLLSSTLILPGDDAAAE